MVTVTGPASTAVFRLISVVRSIPYNGNGFVNLIFGTGMQMRKLLIYFEICTLLHNMLYGSLGWAFEIPSA